MRCDTLKPFLLSVLFLLSGCAQATESLKTIWGSSTRALEKARDEAIRKTYYCGFNECYDTSLKLAKKAEYEIFIDDRIQEHIVVMGIKGNVNTTEVGIFFEQLDRSQVKIDVSSLSSSAKEKVARTIFEGLDKEFKVKISKEVSHEN